MAGHVHRAEKVANGNPLPGELLDVGMLGRRIVGMESLNVGELRVGRGKDAAVERAEKPRLFRGPGCQECLFPVDVGRVHVPGKLARRARGGQLVARN